jgi:membrane protein
MVFQAMPAYRDVGEKVRLFLYEQLNLDRIVYPSEEQPGQEVKLTDKIDEITDQYISKLNTGAITLFSCVIVVWAALALLTTIERSFNSIWHVSRGRNFLQRIVNYWALMTLGPFLLVLGFYLIPRYLSAEGLQQGWVVHAQNLLPYLVSVLAFFLLYYVLPNTRVSIRAAIWGSVVAALIWTGAKHLFAVYVMEFIPQRAIYGVMGIVPLGVFWIWITWLVVLFGLQLTYTTQHLKSLDAAELASMRKADEHFLVSEFTVIRVFEYILERFEHNRGPVAGDAICGRLHLPAEFGGKLLDHLVGKGLLVATSEPHAGYMPATDGENITLAQVVEAVRDASFDQNREDDSAQLRQIIDSQHQQLSQITLKELVEGRKA